MNFTKRTQFEESLTNYKSKRNTKNSAILAQKTEPKTNPIFRSLTYLAARKAVSYSMLRHDRQFGVAFGFFAAHLDQKFQWHPLKNAGQWFRSVDWPNSFFRCFFYLFWFVRRGRNLPGHLSIRIGFIMMLSAWRLMGKTFLSIAERFTFSVALKNCGETGSRKSKTRVSMQ